MSAATRAGLKLIERRKGWSTETLKEHLCELRKADHRFDKERDRRYYSERKSDRRRMDAFLASNEKALNLLAEQQKEYKTASNEWRGTLNDLVTRMMTRTEVEGTLTSINAKLDQTFSSINQKIDRQHGELLAQVTALQAVNVKDVGKDEGLELARKNQRYIIGLAIGVPGLILALAGVAALFGAK
jgi:chromosome segregation ATPase